MHRLLNHKQIHLSYELMRCMNQTRAPGTEAGRWLVLVCAAVRTSSRISEFPLAKDRLRRWKKSKPKFSLRVWHLLDPCLQSQFPTFAAQNQRACPALFPVFPYNVSKQKDPAYKAGCLCRSVFMENTMLSPHEFATLLLVQEAPNQVDMEREELDALLERQLVQLENLASGRQQWRLTATGDSTVKAFKRYP
ncbi:FIG00453722: hypothetical protein [Candidatus Paraburkholderia kirkii UZHbot1]|uniref:Uncharacterized protein n=1 Tax=Candidatus Paraburkholderia kirkii UZHbot1 TaxID=1055526 RepID=G4MAK8_9BURK|nr:FIG00453722: hypothetical protein [Candidatus Paraburkholderia kirkii UZHbot1]